MKNQSQQPGQGKRPDQYESAALLFFCALAALAFVIVVIATKL